MDFSTRITVGGQQVILVDPTLEGTQAWMKANALFYPLGPEPSEAWLLMTGEAVRALTASAAADSLSIIWEIHTAPGKFTRYTFPGWKFVKAERLLHGGNEQPTSLYLAQFADGRYFARENSDSGSIRANIRSYAQSSSYLTGTSGYTWTSLVTELWNACTFLGAFPGLPGGLPIDSVPETSFFIGLNAYQALNAVLNQLDCAIAPTPSTGAFTIVQLGGDQELPNYPNNLVWDGEPIGTNADIAATLKIYFNYHYKNYGQEKDTELVDNWAYNGAGSVGTTNTDVTGASGTKPLWEDMPWVLLEDGSHANYSDIITRMANRKSRYVTRYTVDLVHKVYSSIRQDFKPGGQLRGVLFRNWGIPNFDFGGTQTEIIGGPEFVSYRTDKNGLLEYSKKELAAPEYENYSPLDLGRRSYPNYPRLPQLVKVVHTSGSTGDVVSANGDGLHPGFVYRVTNGTMTQYEACWILIVNNYDVNSGNVNSNQHAYYLGRLMGVKTSGADQRPLYVVDIGEGTDEIVHFRLEATLTIGGTAQAALLSLAAGVWNDSGTDIEVCDWYANGPGMWNGLTGYEGLAVRRGDEVNGRSAYDIVWMERKAQWIRGTTSEYIGASVAGRVSVVVDHYDAQGRDPGGTVNCFDPNNLFPATFSGAEVLAEYDNKNERYELKLAQQVVRFATALLNGTLCGSGSATIDTFVGIPQSLDVGDPDTIPTSVDNAGAFAGEDNDPALIMRTSNSPSNPTWTLVRVKLKERDLVSNVEITGGNLVQTKKNVWVHACNNTETDSTIAATTECTPP